MSARKGTDRRKQAERRSGRDVLTRLAPHEAVAVLRELLERHPELAREARRIARALTADVSPEAIAAEIEHAVLGLGHDALRSRAGRHEWGYVDPGDAAWELLQ